MDWLIEIDWQLMRLLNFDGGPFMDALMYGVSYKFTWVPLYLLLVWLAWRKNSLLAEKERYYEFALFVLVTVLVIAMSDQIASGLIKTAVQRPRPSHQEGLMESLHYVNEYRGGAYGFVSSHASNSIAMVMWVYYYLTRGVGNLITGGRKHLLMAGLVLFLVLNCYSRIYLGVHYLGDILGGLAVGLFTAKMGIVMYQRMSYWITKEHC